jgi:hypothetical protein
MGEFFTLGRLLTFGWQIIEYCKSSANYWATFIPRNKLCINFEKMGWAF